MNNYAQRNQIALEFFKNYVVVYENKESASFYFFGFFNFSGQNFVTGANGRGILQDFQSQFRPEFHSQMLTASHNIRKNRSKRHCAAQCCKTTFRQLQ